VHCVALAEDGLLYVCDRVNDRVQIFRTDGTFVREVFYATNTLATGSDRWWTKLQCGNRLARVPP